MRECTFLGSPPNRNASEYTMNARHRIAETFMNWFVWRCFPAFFAGLTAILAKVGVQQIGLQLGDRHPHRMILIFAWSVALFTNSSAFDHSAAHWIFFDPVGLPPDSLAVLLRACNLARPRRLRPWIV